jgi:tRNA threonylcarbamoyl adenosine modification protein YeaZ
MNALLVIDCAFSDAMLGLRINGRMEHRSFGPQRSHALRLVSEVEALLKHTGIKAEAIGRVGIGQGPGSFTGLRVALATGNGIATALGAELVGFSTFDALPVFEGSVLHAFDARKGVVYCGLREGAQWLHEPAPRPLDEAMAISAQATHLYGDASQRYPELIQHLKPLQGPFQADPKRALDLSAQAAPNQLVLPTYKEGAQAQILFGTPKLGRALDGDELKTHKAAD